MTLRTGRGSLSIFARTFLLLAVALLVVQGVGLGVLIMRKPVLSPPVQLPEVVALLSSQMPSGNHHLRVRDAATAPEAPDGGYRDDMHGRLLLADWLDTDVDYVRFFVRSDGTGLGFPANRRGPLPRPARANAPEDESFPPPEGLPQDWPYVELDRPPLPGGFFDFRSGFIAAARQPDGRWRVVETSGPGFHGAFRRQVAMVFVVGLLLMVPMAWWFSRALSAPIRRFADAADQLGQNPDAPPLARSGPPELVQAADSFNAMQARLTRLINERMHMVAAIAHDLRTPLARLAFRLEGLPLSLREKTTGDIAEMKAMIAAALDFIRDQSRPGIREQLDFRLLVESVVDDLSDTDHDVVLAPGRSVTINGDPLALRRMIVNLVENALKYGLRARLSLQREGVACRLLIDDDGPGIDPAQRDQLFTPFFRGEASRNRDTGGIGLGLSAAHNIALAHGGEISLDNRPEGGLRVTVLMPCQPEHRARR